MEPLILCPDCRTEMHLFAIEPETEIRDIYTFRCDNCQRLEFRSLQATFGEAIATADYLDIKAGHFFDVAEVTADPEYAREADETKRQPSMQKTAVEHDGTLDLTWRGAAIGLVSLSALCAVFLFLIERATSAPMYFIERYLGFSPDSGDGSLELFLVLALITLVAATGLRFAVR